ncbi:hypothetical protein PG995_008093 [Apiospora arundinis]
MPNSQHQNRWLPILASDQETDAAAGDLGRQEPIPLAMIVLLAGDGELVQADVVVEVGAGQAHVALDGGLVAADLAGADLLADGVGGAVLVNPASSVRVSDAVAVSGHGGGEESHDGGGGEASELHFEVVGWFGLPGKYLLAYAPSRGRVRIAGKQRRVEETVAAELCDLLKKGDEELECEEG